MRGRWEKMTRWAGIGHNGSDAVNGRREDAMVDEMKDTLEQDQAEGGAERVEAGMETGHADATEQAGDSAELAQLRGERDQLIDRLARLQAEFDNARKREARERADAREYTVGSTVEPFLGVMDNFNLALKAPGSVEQLRAGVELILKQMEEALRGLNVTAVETVGTQFDPRVHEALGSVETVEFPDHQVIEEIRKGYKIREKLLRPAMVKIAVNKAMVND
jgi:molecular chaperone GrpE